MLLSSENRPSLESISTSLLVLSLDSYTLPSLPTTDPLRLLSIDAQLRACSSGINGGENRWFDKSMSLIVENNGRAGLMGEHSPVDASIPSAAVKYALAQPVESGAFRNNSHKTAGKFIRHDWKVEEAFRNEIEECRSRNKKVVEDSDATQLWWSEYGCDWIQNTGRSFGCVHDTLADRRSEAIAGRVHPASSTIGLVPRSGLCYGHLRDGIDAIYAARPDGCDPFAHIRQPGVCQSHDGRQD